MELIKRIFAIYYELLVYAGRTASTKFGGIRHDKGQKMSRKSPRYRYRWLKFNIAKILFKNQRPSAERGPAPSRRLSHIPCSIGSR
jgi:hypothetical protein